MKTLSAAIVLCAAASAATAKDFNYNYVEVGYWDRSDVIDIDLRDDDVENDGYSLKLSLHTQGGLLFQLGARQGESDKYWGANAPKGADTDLEAYSVLVGGANQYSADLSFWGGLGYERQDISLPYGGLATGYSDLNTWSLGGGARYWLLPMVEVNGGLNYVHVKGGDGLTFNDNDLQVSVGARFEPIKWVSIGVGYDYRLDSGADALSADLRLQF
ncbi:MAG TPA: outer membrane beta-barrel protein [Spongiibacteraceae bacterium]|jgi:long-subunit fatty acid transport protein|nr:outer membrane beta-barrel protein [Spongiibacteraceae bacterium]HUH37964.1 outer membrane beta-barrel protein [Spongiibacteraceae bacterium]